jgi:superoxide reductase
MTSLNQMYKCELCGNMSEMTHPGDGELFCCTSQMKLMEEKSDEAGLEKHLPLVENDGSIVRVTIGSILHPMEEIHYIEWIELLADGIAYRKYLKPGEAPIAEFCLSSVITSARAYCNVHGLWRLNFSKK